MHTCRHQFKNALQSYHSYIFLWWIREGRKYYFRNGKFDKDAVAANRASNKYSHLKVLLYGFWVYFFFVLLFLPGIEFYVLSFSHKCKRGEILYLQLQQFVSVTICLCCFCNLKGIFFQLIMQHFKKKIHFASDLIFKRIFHAPTIFNVKLINRHWTRDNMM